MPQRGWTYLPGWNDGLSQQHKSSSCSKKDKEDNDWYYNTMRRKREEEEENEKYIKKKLKASLWYGDNVHGIFTRDINGEEVKIIGYKRISWDIYKLIFKHTKQKRW